MFDLILFKLFFWALNKHKMNIQGLYFSAKLIWFDSYTS